MAPEPENLNDGVTRVMPDEVRETIERENEPVEQIGALLVRVILRTGSRRVAVLAEVNQILHEALVRAGFSEHSTIRSEWVDRD